LLQREKRQISIKIVEQMSLVTLFIVSLSKVTIGEREDGWDRRALPPYSYHHTILKVEVLNVNLTGSWKQV